MTTGYKTNSKYNKGKIGIIFRRWPIISICAFGNNLYIDMCLNRLGFCIQL